MFVLETVRNLNDELKYELYKDLIENVTYFKRIIDNLTVSTKDEEKRNKFIDLENFKNMGNSKILIDTDTIVIKWHYVAKKSECKYLGLILDSSLSFHAQIKKILQKMAQGIKTIDTIGQQLPTLSLVALLHCLVLSHLDYSAIFLQQINATLMLSLEKQLNWALKRTYFRSKFKSSSLLRISKSFIGIEKRIELKCITYLYQYLTNKKKAFQNTLRLPTANYRLNKRTKQIIFDKHCSTASLQKSFFHLTSKKRNSLPIFLRNLEKSRAGFKKKLKEFYVSELRNNPICTNTNTWRDFRFC